MKRLILLRHAKSSWANAGQRDIDRPLNERGIRDAPRMGTWLSEAGYLPDLALVSTATRTRQTWAGVAPVLGNPPVDFLPELYHADPGRMMRALRGRAAGTVLMIGHQPGIGEMADRLLANPPGDEDFGRFPTAATAVLEFAIPDWDALGWKSGQLLAFAVPKSLA